jgi:hypothetical protein
LPDEKIDAVLRELQAGRERDADAERRNAATSTALLSAINKLEAAIKSSIYTKGDPATERASMGTLLTVAAAVAAIGAFALGTVVSDVGEINAAMSADNDRERIYAAANSEQEARLRFLESAVHGRVSHESQ